MIQTRGALADLEDTVGEYGEAARLARDTLIAVYGYGNPVDVVVSHLNYASYFSHAGAPQDLCNAHRSAALAVERAFQTPRCACPSTCGGPTPPRSPACSTTPASTWSAC